MEISNDNKEFLNAMINLAEKDPIEYQLKMSQLKVNLAQQKTVEEKFDNQVHCPFCQSTDVHKISGTERAVSIIGLGIFSKKINKSFKCNSCKGTF